MANTTSFIMHSFGVPAFRVTSPPLDSEIRSEEYSGTRVFVCQTEPMYTIGIVEERSVTHTEQTTGNILMTEPEYRLRWDLEFQILRTSGMIGGLAPTWERLIDTAGELEFFIYLKRHFHDFSGNGGSGLEFVLNFNPSLVWGSVGQDISFEVVPLSITIGQLESDYHICRMVLISKTYTSIPYSYTANRRAGD